MTGGARGIGKAIALRLAAEGASVVIADIERTLAAETAAEARSLARELGSDGIRVNSIAPGLTTTDAAMIHGQEAAERGIRTRTIPRAETPEDITGAVVFLASAASEFITGQLLVVNGRSVLH